MVRSTGCRLLVKIFLYCPSFQRNMLHCVRGHELNVLDTVSLIGKEGSEK